MPVNEKVVREAHAQFDAALHAMRSELTSIVVKETDDTTIIRVEGLHKRCVPFTSIITMDDAGNITICTDCVYALQQAEYHIKQAFMRVMRSRMGSN